MNFTDKHNNTESYVDIARLLIVASDLLWLTLYQPMTHICKMSSHKPIRMYYLGCNMVGKGLKGYNVDTLEQLDCVSHDNASS